MPTDQPSSGSRRSVSLSPTPTATKAFRLRQSFLDKWQSRQPEWGFNGLGAFVYQRTYSRLKDDGTRESWFDTCKRVTEGVYSIQKRHIKDHDLGWDGDKAHKSAEEFFERMFLMKFLPPGRGLWAMGSPIIEERGLSAALQNCGAVSTANIDKDFARPFTWMADASMLGVGVGFDVDGAGKVRVNKNPEPSLEKWVVPDTREGWVQSIELLLNTYTNGHPSAFEFDYSQIRPAGEPIRTFGGVSAGSAPLMQLHRRISIVLDDLEGKHVSVRAIADLMNQEGACVVSGNVRRSAQIAFGSANNQEYLDLKNYAMNPEREAWGWASNNSVRATLGQNYSEVAKRIRVNGEPGLAWFENVRRFGRIGEEKYGRDKATLFNPCLTADTFVYVADGRGHVPLGKLAEEGKDVPVFCYDDKRRVVVRMMRNPRQTGSAVPVLKVNLDDGSSIKATPNHQFLLNDGRYVAAKDLRAGDSLAIITKYASSLKTVFGQGHDGAYWWIANGQRNNKAEHGVIAEYFYGKVPRGSVVHHIDRDGKNNHPSNLQVLTKQQHDEEHRKDMVGDNNPMRRAKTEWSEEKWAQYHTNMSAAVSGSKNGNFNGVTTEEYKEHALRLCKTLGRRYSRREWVTYCKENGLPRYVCEWRGFNQLSLAKWAARELGFEHVDADPRTVRYLQRLLAKGYDAFLEPSSGSVGVRLPVVRKQCEVCGTTFDTTSEISATCGLSCTNVLRWRTGNISKERVHDGIKRGRQKRVEQCIAAYRAFQEKERREPTDVEWAQILCALDIKQRGYSLSKIVEASALQNHKVVSVESCGNADVYNGTVDEYHNFFVGGFERMNEQGKPRWAYINSKNCGEQPLEPFELCTLVETFPMRHTTLEDYLRTLKFAYLYAKTVTLLKTHWPETNRVMHRNRRVGVSMSGIAQFISSRGIHDFKEWCRAGYDTVRYYDGVYSDWFGVKNSIRVTTVKPSGTVSLLAGATPGVHYPEARFYLRRVRIGVEDPLVGQAREAGYVIEADKHTPNTAIVQFPIDAGVGLRPANEVSMWEQFKLGATLQREWSDNAVSQTVKFQPNEARDIEAALEFYQYELKSCSMMPWQGGYEQMPYEAITESQYQEALGALKPARFLGAGQVESEKFCDGDKCLII